MKKSAIFTSAAVLAVVATLAAPTYARSGDGDRRGPDFSELDANSDGFITAEELTARQTERFEAIDVDGNGEITVEEMQAAIEARNAERQQTRFERMFERLDADDSGTLSSEELASARRGNMIERLDQNDDGQIDAEEFAAKRGGKHHHGKRGHGQGETNQ